MVVLLGFVNDITGSSRCYFGWATRLRVVVCQSSLLEFVPDVRSSVLWNVVLFAAALTVLLASTQPINWFFLGES